MVLDHNAQQMKNIIFDWSGVIKDAFTAHLWVVNKIFQDHRLKQFTSEELRKEWDEPYMNFYSKYFPEWSIEDEQREYMKWMKSTDYPKPKVYPGIVDLLKKIKAGGNYLALISADLPDSLLSEMREFGLDHIFDDVVTDAHDKIKSVLE
jgi:phosphoglycolate phosphatase